jgi:hypothetical protein
MPAFTLGRQEQKYSFSRKLNDRGKKTQLPHGDALKCPVEGPAEARSNVPDGGRPGEYFGFRSVHSPQQLQEYLPGQVACR